MACSDVFELGEPLQIIYLADREKDGKKVHELETNKENLEKIMSHPEVKDRPVVIVSIAGAFRKGKSFLLGFFLKYMEEQRHGVAELNKDWLKKDDKIKGFQWRGGTERVTVGIQIWSEPFITENKFGEKVAVLLMDTQGVFDNDSTIADCTCIFALTNLISSVQMYNLMQQIQEDNLQHLEFFTEFGKLVSENSGDIGNSRLVFVIRDWGYPYEYPYGNDGGEAYVNKILKVKPTHPEELQNIRKKLEEWFPNTGGFLLPHPGKIVAANPTFNGTVKDIDDEFVENVKLLVHYILSKDKLVIKRINGMDVAGKNMLKYIEAFVSVLKTGELPTPQTLFQAAAEVGRQLAIDAGFKIYVEEMEKICESANGTFMFDHSLKSHDDRIKKKAREHLQSYPRMQRAENQSECLEKLNDLMKKKYVDFKETIQKQNDNFLLKKVAPFIATIGIGIAGGVALIAFNLKK